MGKLRPIGSEKLQGVEKINRIIEIARYKENIPTPVNESVSNEYNITLADGNVYSIDRERNGYVIKKRIDESTFDYLEPMKNRNYYRSYSQAFKRLNLIAKEVNTLVGNQDEISLFNEQKYVLKTPKAEPAPVTEPEPSPEPAPDEMPPSDEGMDLPTDTMDEPTMDSGMPSDEPSDMGMDSEASPAGEEDSFKTVQKLTGKLAQKIRSVNDEDLSSDNIKYIVNSILSALDLSKLEDEDKDEIINRLEPEEEMSSDETETETPSPDDMGMEEPQPPSETEESELYEVSDSEMPGILSKKIASSVAGNMAGKLHHESEIDEEGIIRNTFERIFSESKVDKILSKYFKISESEEKELNRKKMIQEAKIHKNKVNNLKEIERLSESDRQSNTAKEVIKKYPYAKVIGSTNKHNLVIEHKGEQIKITPKGQIL